jgi:hypothetical protein
MRDSTVDLPHVTRFRPAVVLLALSLAFAAFTAEPPPLRKGLWEFNRTVEGQGPGGKPVTMTNKKCADPAADRRRMNELLTKQGCKLTASAVRGNTSTSSSECQVQGVTVQSRSVITVESDSAYRAQVTTTGGGRSTKELLVAKRVGEC